MSRTTLVLASLTLRACAFTHSSTALRHHRPRAAWGAAAVAATPWRTTTATFSAGIDAAADEPAPPAEAAAAEAIAAAADERKKQLIEPPLTFVQCTTQCAASLEDAIGDGRTLLEVDFPPLATEIIENEAVDAYTISRENIRLAIAVAKNLRTSERGMAPTRIAILLPDKVRGGGGKKGGWSLRRTRTTARGAGEVISSPLHACRSFAQARAHSAVRRAGRDTALVPSPPRRTMH